MVCLCTDNKPLPYTVCVFYRQSVSGSLCLSQILCVPHRQHVSVMTICVCGSLTQIFFFFVRGKICLSETVCVCHEKTMPVTDCLCLSKSVCVFHRQYVSVKDSLILSQIVYVYHRQYMSFIDSCCQSETCCVCHGHSVSFPKSQFFRHIPPVFVTDSLCLTQIIFVWCVLVQYFS